MSMRPAERHWVLLILAGLYYEFTADRDELLSDGAHRMVGRWPIMTRLITYAVVLHFMFCIPGKYDVFDASNVFHMTAMRWLRKVRR